MPTYEYTCPDGHEFERFYRKISDAVSDVVCPVCGKPAVRKLSASGFAFKGSGFYLTDYGKNAHRGTGEVVGAAEKSGGDASVSDSKSESKASDSSTKTGESKSGESKSNEPKAGESKSKDGAPAAAKPSESKPSESKPSGGASTTSSSSTPKSDK